jgi:hypothetical protein
VASYQAQLLHSATWVYCPIQLSIYVLAEAAMDTMFNYKPLAGNYNVL